jgi:hypothetical protein
MAGPTRLELATSGVTGRRSNQLNYDPAGRKREIITHRITPRKFYFAPASRPSTKVTSFGLASAFHITVPG